MLAMKLDAARDDDEEDVEALITHLGIRTPAQALEIHRKIFPHTPLEQRGHNLLERKLRKNKVTS